MFKVLVVDDDQALRESVKHTLVKSSRYAVDEAFDGINALEKIKVSEYDIVILDMDMPRLNGIETLKQIKEHNLGIICIMMTAYAGIENAVLAVKEGAYNYLSKPVQGDDLLQILEKAIMAHTLISSVAASSPVLVEEGRKIIGSTAQMQKMFNIIHKLSKVDTPVLIRGASGTGKELVARAIHFNSSRKEGKFVAINCSAIPENLFESELFGHEKGSFTGAEQRKIGKFQYAEGGTLFLDEMGDMPVHMQVKLLRVLQEKVFTPVGSNRDLTTNVRVVAATNRPLEEMIKNGTFREDLFYRLNVIPIFLPPLHERIDDLDNLVRIFIKKFNRVQNKRISSISKDAMSCLKKYKWPGNIRELENVIEHAFIMESENMITLSSLPEYILASTGVNIFELNSHDTKPVDIELEDETSAADLSDTSLMESSDDDEDLSEASAANFSGELNFNAQKEAFEKEFIIKALKTFKGRINQTALHANIPKKTLLRKIEKYGINPKEYVN